MVSTIMETSMRPIPGLVLPFVRTLEACKLKAYPDIAGVWTIGDGHTGPEVHPGLEWTQAQADRQAMADLTVASSRLAARVERPAIDKLSDHQYGALISFVYNAGAGPWTIWKDLNAGRLSAIPGELLQFDHARDPHTGQLVVVKGLFNRRSAEVALWKTADAFSAALIATAVPVKQATNTLRGNVTKASADTLGGKIAAALGRL